MGKNDPGMLPGSSFFYFVGDIIMPKNSCSKKNQVRIHTTTLKSGISRSKEFERKGLAEFSVNIGTKCGHDCLYCSTGAVLRMHESFKNNAENPYGFGYEILDPETPDRIAKDAIRIRNRGLVQVCTTVDAWSPGAQKYVLGRRCLEAILAQPEWTVRVLTKNAAVKDDFDLIEKHRDRVIVGLSLTTTPKNEQVMKIIEPNASSIQERMDTLNEAKKRGLRTFAMLCPLLPGIADSPNQIDELVKYSVKNNAEEIYVEPVNHRGTGLKHCQDALEKEGFLKEAEEIKKIRRRQRWSEYVLDLLRNTQKSVRRHSDIRKLKFLLYPSNLLIEHLREIKNDDAGVIWLNKKPLHA